MTTPAQHSVVDEHRQLLGRLERERAIRLEAERIAEKGIREAYLREQQLKLLSVVAAAASETTRINDFLRVTVAEFCRRMDWSVGHVLVADVATVGRLVSSPAWHLSQPEKMAAFRARTEALEFDSGKGLPGRILASRRPESIAHIGPGGDCRRAEEARAGGLLSAFGFPVLNGGQVVAVFEFFSQVAITPDERLVSLSEQVGALAARVFERERFERNLSELNQNLEHRIARRTAELSESRADLQDFFDNASDLIQSVDEHGRYHFVNRAWCDTLGYTQEELPGLSIFDVIDPSQHQHCQAALADLIGTSKPIRIETIFRTKDGRQVLVEGHINVRREPDRPILTRGVFRDITARKAAETQTRRQLSAIEAARDGIAWLDEDGRYLYLNRTHVRMFGFASAKDLIGRSWRELYTPEEVARIEGDIFQSLQRDGHWNGRATARRKDGTEFPEGLSLTLIPGGGLVCVCRDDSAQVETENQLLRSLAKEKELHEMKTRFVSMASHELRTPLSTLSLGVDLLAKRWRQMKEEQIVKNLEIVDRGVDDLRHILDDLLLIGQGDEGQIRCRRTRVDLVALARRCADECHRVDREQHTINLECDRDTWPASVDPQLIKHIVTNLLSNACKYSPDAETVRLRLAGDADEVTFTVADNGIGIPEEDQPRLFDFFVRAGNVGNIRGTGLGLMVVRRCLEAHGGRISFESAPDRGSTFHATFPLQPATAWNSRPPY